MNSKNEKNLKMTWIYKSLKNETPKKFLIINEYEIDDSAVETGSISWGMEDEQMLNVSYVGADKGAEITHKISMEAVKKGFVVERLEDGHNTFIADEDNAIAEDEEEMSSL